MKIAVIVGTRPEAIKLAPVVLGLRAAHHEVSVVSTGQHQQMLVQVLDLFGFGADVDLAIMQPNQTLEAIAASLLQKLPPVLSGGGFDLVLVQGDTSTAFMAALAAFYQQIPIGHIEAGLRTRHKYNPFPEEMNRRLLTQLADLHFAPTDTAKQNLLHDGVPEKDIFVTGNTVIDALLWVCEHATGFSEPKLIALDPHKRTILLTTHRRENLGADMEQIFAAMKRITGDFADVQVVFPVHLNPKIQQHVRNSLGDTERVIITPPLNYADLALLMKQTTLILTDSGGIQEEAPALGKPVLVLRQTTERPEGVAAGTAALIGTGTEAIYTATARLLSDTSAYEAMAKAVNPYGDGTAARQIVSIIEQYAQTR